MLDVALELTGKNLGLTGKNLGLTGKNHVLLAVSGGSDSTALLLLAVKQIKTLSNPAKLTVVTIDHALRAESAAEAAAVASLCQQLGVPHVTRRWEGEKRLTGIQARARDARRVLIAEIAGQIGADLVLTGHTLDDQRETVTMRARRGSGPGLAGIAPASLVFDDAGNGEGVWFARPLLKYGRQALRDFLVSEGVGWIDDPSNNNTAFERIAMRNRLAEMSVQTLAEIDQVQQDTAALRREGADEAARLLPLVANFAAPGLLFLDRALFAGGPSGGRILLLRTLMSFVAGTPQFADALHARVLFDTAAKHQAKEGTKAERLGAGGVLAEIRANGVFLLQERRRGSANARPFAGRYRMVGKPSPPIEPSPLPLIVLRAPAALVRHAALSEPVFVGPQTAALPASEAARQGLQLRMLLNPWPDLVPSFDFELAAALARMAGARRLPALAL